jgi:hypothetical protein
MTLIHQDNNFIILKILQTKIELSSTQFKGPFFP